MTGSSPPETWVLCGGADHPDAPASALRISSAGNDPDISVNLQGITDALLRRVPAEYRDLILIASYVVTADQAVYRGSPDDTNAGASSPWRRRFRFVINVKRPEFWSAPAMMRALESTLGFLSDDSYSFKFHADESDHPEQFILSTDDGSPWFEWGHVQDVQLFSGGLDSLGGAAEQFLRDQKDIIVVSHRSAAKTIGVQNRLVEALRNLRTGGHLHHVAIDVKKHRDDLRQERTQRSRSFLYAAIAGTVAHLVGRQRILFYENGIVSINLPVAGDVTGAKATRTTHPRVLAGFATILSILSGGSFAVENPYDLMTRADVLRSIVNCGAGSLIRHTVSCAYIRKSSHMHPHCGICSQCIDRQFAVRAAGLEHLDSEEGYEIQLVEGRRDTDESRKYLLDYIKTAETVAGCKNEEDFLGSFGEVARALVEAVPGAATRLKQIFDLYQRHSRDAVGVLSDIHAKYNLPASQGHLPRTSLVLLRYREALSATEPAAEVGDEELNRLSDLIGQNAFHPYGDTWMLRFRGKFYKGHPCFHLKPSAGLKYLHVLLRRPNEPIDALEVSDIVAGRDPSLRPRSSALTIDKKTKLSLFARLTRRREDLVAALDCGDEEEVRAARSEIRQLEDYLGENLGPGGRLQREPKDQKKARDAVAGAIKEAIEHIAEYDDALARHFKERVSRKAVCQYLGDGVRWVTEQTASSVGNT